MQCVRDQTRRLTDPFATVAVRLMTLVAVSVNYCKEPLLIYQRMTLSAKWCLELRKGIANFQETNRCNFSF